TFSGVSSTRTTVDYPSERARTSSLLFRRMRLRPSRKCLSMRSVREPMAPVLLAAVHARPLRKSASGGSTAPLQNHAGQECESNRDWRIRELKTFSPVRGRSFLVHYLSFHSGTAAPSARGSEAPKFTPVALLCITTLPRPMSTV